MLTRIASSTLSLLACPLFIWPLIAYVLSSSLTSASIITPNSKKRALVLLVGGSGSATAVSRIKLCCALRPHSILVAADIFERLYVGVCMYVYVYVYICVCSHGGRPPPPRVQTPATLAPASDSCRATRLASAASPPSSPRRRPSERAEQRREVPHVPPPRHEHLSRLCVVHEVVPVGPGAGGLPFWRAPPPSPGTGDCASARARPVAPRNNSMPRSR